MAEHERTTGARWRPAPVLLLTIGFVALYATGVIRRPHDVTWAMTYDVVLYNLPYLATSAACFAAASRVRVERIAWFGMGVALTLSAVGNALRVLSAGVEGTGPTSAVATLV